MERALDDSTQHFDLLGAGFKIIKIAGKGSAVLNVGGNLIGIQGQGIVDGDQRREGNAAAEEETVIRFVDAFCFHRHAPLFLEGGFEDEGTVPIKPFREANRLREDLDGEIQDFGVKGVEDNVGKAGIIEGAVTVGDDTAEHFTEGAEVVPTAAWHGNGG